MNNIEIERKFLVDIRDTPDISKRHYQDIRQGYVKNFGDFIYRLREVKFTTSNQDILNYKYYQTIKGCGGIIRAEHEIELTEDQFNVVWPLCNEYTLHKHRYILNEDDILYKNINFKEIALDVYCDNLCGFYTIEVEFNDEEDSKNYIPEPWFGKEVTEDSRYSNFNLNFYGKPE
jgi:CYTH domain-containing protein